MIQHKGGNALVPPGGVHCQVGEVGLTPPIADGDLCLEIRKGRKPAVRYHQSKANAEFLIQRNTREVWKLQSLLKIYSRPKELKY